MSSDSLLLKFTAVFAAVAIFVLVLGSSTGGNIRLVGWSELQSSFTTGPQFTFNLPPAPVLPSFDWNVLQGFKDSTAFVGAVLLWIGGLLAAVLGVVVTFFVWVGGIIYNGLIATFSLATFNIQGLPMPDGVLLVLRAFGFMFIMLVVLTFARLIRGNSP